LCPAVGVRERRTVAVLGIVTLDRSKSKAPPADRGRRVIRDDRGNGVDNRPPCDAIVTKLVDKSLDAATSIPVLLVLPEGATNI
jgi:hypothetical protein